MDFLIMPITIIAIVITIATVIRLEREELAWRRLSNDEKDKALNYELVDRYLI